MNAHDRRPDDELRNAFRNQAADTPDPQLVHTRVHTALNRRQRRRQAATAGGIALAVAGLALGANTLDLPSRQQDPAAVATAPTSQPTSQPTSDPGDGPSGTATGPAPDATSQATTSGPNEALATFWDNDFTLEDARALADLWNADVVSAKAVAGQRLLDGGRVPVAPERGVLPGEPRVEAVWHAQQAFYDAGLGYEDALVLGELWEFDNPAVVKAVAGQQLLGGGRLPLAQP